MVAGNANTGICMRRFCVSRRPGLSLSKCPAPEFMTVRLVIAEQ